MQKKLVLRRETVRSLTEESLVEVVCGSSETMHCWPVTQAPGGCSRRIHLTDTADCDATWGLC
jgi:hypothetical protein